MKTNRSYLLHFIKLIESSVKPVFVNGNVFTHRSVRPGHAAGRSSGEDERAQSGCSSTPEQLLLEPGDSPSEDGQCLCVCGGVTWRIQWLCWRPCCLWSLCCTQWASVRLSGCLRRRGGPARACSPSAAPTRVSPAAPRFQPGWVRSMWHHRLICFRWFFLFYYEAAFKQELLEFYWFLDLPETWTQTWSRCVDSAGESNSLNLLVSGSYSLSWMFLSSSSLLSLTALLAVRPALSRGRKPIAALLLNITSSKTHHWLKLHNLKAGNTHSKVTEHVLNSENSYSTFSSRAPQSLACSCTRRLTQSRRSRAGQWVMSEDVGSGFWGREFIQRLLQWIYY